MSKKNENPYIPPKELNDYPIVITPQIFNDGAIKAVLERMLKNPKLDTLIAVAPFISTYFPRFLVGTSVKHLILLINREKLNPEYVDDAVEKLKDVNFSVEVRERPKKSNFIHMKLLIPYVKVQTAVFQLGKSRTQYSLVPMCAISGSVNFTKNGISRSDEALIILRDTYSISAFEKTYDTLLYGSKIRFHSRGGSSSY